MAKQVEPIYNRKHYVVTDDVMTLRNSSQMLCNVCNFSTEY